MPSIQRRLNGWLLLGSSLLLAVVGLYAGRRIAAGMEREFDWGLQSEVLALVTLTKQAHGRVELDFADEFMPQFSRDDEPEYFEVWLDDDQVLERSRSLGRADLPRLAQWVATVRFRDVPLPDGASGRLAQLSFVPQVEDVNDTDGEKVVALDSIDGVATRAATIAIARRRTRLDAAIGRMQRLLLTTGAVILLGLIVLVSSVTRWGLAPLVDVGRQVESLHSEALHERIELAHAPLELQPLIDKVNVLLANLEKAFSRERQLSADIAHELKTPVAELHNLAEVGRRWPEKRERVERFFEDALSISRRMNRTIDDLSSLARYEANKGQLELDLQPVDLEVLVRSSWSAVAAAEDTSRLELSVDIGVAEPVTDIDKARRIIDNLLRNACEYAPANAKIRCSIGPRAAIVIANPAPDLSPSDLPHLFERFWRRDPARTGGAHTGVGLALSQAMATVLGASLTASLDAGSLAMTLDLASRRSA